jgi:pimeloyl-ACP methyl ester carboxylesterase
MRAAIRWRVDAEGSGLRELDAPVVIVASEGDPWHPAALARTFAALAPRSDLTVAAGIADLVAPGAIGSQVVAGLERMGVR